MDRQEYRPENDKVHIKLSPYTAMAILGFLREWVNDDVPDEYQYAAIKEAVAEYQKEVSVNMTNDQLEDARLENSVNKLIGKSPNNSRI